MMDAKTAVLVVESAIDLYEGEGTSTSNLEDLRDFITEQVKYAESWNFAIDAKNEWAKLMCSNNGKFKMRDDECCEYEDKDCGCQWYKICRKESELMGDGRE